ncbi:MAG: hypothetical protein M3O46_04290 [Myxococcota bacterium]|nr:hypothetical protein [Myxococcota bacterium]
MSVDLESERSHGLALPDASRKTCAPTQSSRSSPSAATGEARPKPFLTTREATTYCGFRTTGAPHKAKLDGRLLPSAAEVAAERSCGAANRSTSTSAARALLPSDADVRERLRRPTEAKMKKQQWVRKWNSWVDPRPALPGVFRRKEGGFLVRGRITDPKTGSMRQVVRNLLDLTEPEQARLWLKTELDSIRKGMSRPTNKQPERFATYATSLLRDKVEKRQICSSTTEEKWMFALRHLFGLKDDEGTTDVGIKGLGDVFVDKLTRADIETWRDSWEPRINTGTYSPTTVNDWISILRVITKKMKADFSFRPTRARTSNKSRRRGTARTRSRSQTP